MLSAGYERLKTPAQEREVVISVRDGRELGGVRFREMVLSVFAALDVREVVPDRATKERIRATQHAVVHLIAIVLPVVEHGPREIPHLVRGIALGGREIHGAHEIRTSASTDGSRFTTETWRHVVDERLRVSIEISEQRLGEVESVGAEEWRVGELDVEVPPDHRPRRAVKPRSVQVEDRAIGPH